MSIRKLKKYNNFTTVSNDFLRDDNLSWKAKGLITYLISLPDEWNINISDLKNRSKDGRDSTANALKEIIDNGYGIKTQSRNETGKFDSYDYEISDIKIKELNLPKTDFPNTENPELVNTIINKDIYKGEDENKHKEKDYKTEKEVLNKVAHLFEHKYYDTDNKKKAWCEEIRKLIEIDGENPETIIKVIEFAKQDDFWNQNLLSIQALRKKNKSGVMKYDNIKAKLPKQHNQPKNNEVYKNGAKPAKESDIITTLGDEATYNQNVIECKFKYVEFESKVYVVRNDINGRFIITTKGRIEI